MVGVKFTGAHCELFIFLRTFYSFCGQQDEMPGQCSYLLPRLPHRPAAANQPPRPLPRPTRGILLVLATLIPIVTPQTSGKTCVCVCLCVWGGPNCDKQSSLGSSGSISRKVSFQLVYFFGLNIFFLAVPLVHASIGEAVSLHSFKHLVSLDFLSCSLVALPSHFFYSTDSNSSQGQQEWSNYTLFLSH